MAQRLKRLPAKRKTWVRSLGQKDPLGKEMVTHSSTLAWKIPWTEELGGLQSTGCKESDMTEQLHFHFHIYIYIDIYDLRSYIQAGPTSLAGQVVLRLYLIMWPCPAPIAPPPYPTLGTEEKDII